MNETIKEDDWVIYAGRPSEKFLVKKSCDKEFMYISLDGNTNSVYFFKTGMLSIGDTNPIVKKTTPPKKKVLKEFDGKMSYNKDLSSFTTGPVLSANICKTINPRDFEAKIIIEIEE